LRRVAAFRLQVAGSSPAMTSTSASRYSAAMDRRSLYDDDIYAWAQQQAEVLRRMAEARRDLPNELDLENVAEEIEDVGRSELSKVESFIQLILVHLIKAASASHAPSLRKWALEVRLFHAQLLKNLSRSMRGKIDLDEIWRLALIAPEADLVGEGDELIADPPRVSPFSLDELTRASLNFEQMVGRIKPMA
jgi:Domain of unknown function DUF29